MLEVEGRIEVLERKSCFAFRSRMCSSFRRPVAIRELYEQVQM